MAQCHTLLQYLTAGDLIHHYYGYYQIYLQGLKKCVKYLQMSNYFNQNGMLGF